MKNSILKEIFEDKNHKILDELVEIIMENSFLNKENNWTPKQMETRATYDSFRIMNSIKKIILDKQKLTN